jgi:hypothetical protein
VTSLVTPARLILKLNWPLPASAAVMALPKHQRESFVNRATGGNPACAPRITSLTCKMPTAGVFVPMDVTRICHGAILV